MAKSDNQKKKLLYILECLKTRSDENHIVTMKEMLQYLEEREIKAERKSVYADINILIDFGYDIVSVKARDSSGYYLASREFELPELKLLVDAVQASKFVTTKKSSELIGKLENFASVEDAKQLRRSVTVSDRIKTENESIYYSVDTIHSAIQQNLQITFQYYNWGADGKMHFKHEGAVYEISPFYLIWKDENYYLVAYDSKAGITKHFRVDKMYKISLSEKKREGQEITGKENPAKYAGKQFGMFAGREELVTLQFEESMIGVIIDRFGKEVPIRKRESNLYSARIHVEISNQFFGWLSGFGHGNMQILMPEQVRNEYIQYIEGILKVYR